jgi:aminobenzoyl-glutamate utilization protein B
LVEEVWTYFREEQSSRTQYESFLSESDEPAIHLNAKILEEYREKMRPHYYDPTRYATYLEQLGIEYPTVREADRTKNE